MRGYAVLFYKEITEERAELTMGWSWPRILLSFVPPEAVGRHARHRQLAAQIGTTPTPIRRRCS